MKVELQKSTGAGPDIVRVYGIGDKLSCGPYGKDKEHLALTLNDAKKLAKALLNLVV